MIITKEVEVEFNTDDFEITDFEFSCDEIKEAVKYNLTIEEQKKIVLSVLHSCNYDEIQEMIASILETLSIENAKEIIQNLDNRFLSLEQYRERALQMQRGSK
ncbi:MULTISPECIES: hypothetical protein [Helicobacter]|uniref:hypothetical protein n=1 Tax=Helicobacter TaxID=209 RepID=UPI002607544C|nr:hypothetical protein [Helicobacter sp. UBA3407]